MVAGRGPDSTAGGHGGEEADEVVGRILDATLEAATVHGARRTSMSDVAVRAGMSRPTLYKRFSSKDELIRAVVQREAGRMVAAIVDAADEPDSAEESLEAAVAVALREAREHPLLDRVIRTEPETLVPMIVADPSPVMVVGRDAAIAVISQRAPHLSALAVRRVADVLIRLLVSYALTPPDDPPEVVAAFVAALLATGLDAPVPSTTVPTDRTVGRSVAPEEA